MRTSRSIPRFCSDDRGAALLEFTIVIGVLITTTLGVVEFSYLFYQWNAASKAVQVGARLVAVSDPIDSTLLDITGMEGGLLPGVPITPEPYFDRECSGATGTCTNGGTYDATAMATLINGLRNVGPDPDPNGLPGMQAIFPRINASNVVVHYIHAGLGYAGRPGGMIPTITVKLVGLNFEFIFLGGLLGFSDIAIPPMTTTITGEDLNVLAP